ncbi:uncharacterized protein N7511_007579 [Penicillium nucicola]|uniref:uncharacterized protein n=1 Tax=Penicillium nucicola TaxID=1850975 RepID=UPI002544EB42|nr:uncharacterized protein N7511_007579 [Penicillium nucicola]KAJ5753426.1 hypothetical protein N7511_007579 [Penicillium nucicola]
MFDCQVAAFFQRQPYISKAEMINAALPCSETFWNASTAWAWKALLGPADIPPSTYFLTTLTTILLYNETTVLPFPPLDEFCRTLYAYVLHSHVFEWRQTICMLNPTGLISSPLSLAPQNIGSSLQERQRWLEICLGNWNSNYGNGSQNTTNDRKSSSGILLYHLAMLALHINFSDLHIVAGRSGSEDDIGLAEQSLRNWLQNDRALVILNRTMQMLDTAWDAIAAGDAQRNSFELAICLFMSGLTCWAMSRFGSPNLMLALQQSAVPLFSKTPRGDGYRSRHQDEQTRNDPESLAGESSLLFQVADARDGLRALKCHRIAVAFGDILDRFLRPLQ